MQNELDLFTQQTDFVKEIDFNLPVANRNDQFHYQIKSELTTREQDVLDAMVRFGIPATMHRIADWMHVGVNTISGRFSKLVEKGKIKPVGKTQEKRPKTLYEVIK